MIRLSFVVLALLALPYTVLFTDSQAATVAATPNLEIRDAGVGRAMIREASGALIVGGGFDRVNGVASAGLIRLLPDGTLDSNWHASASIVHTGGLAQDAQARIYVAGPFDQIDGSPRNGLARFLPGANGPTLDTWQPQLSQRAQDVKVAGGGDVFVLTHASLLRFPAGGVVPEVWSGVPWSIEVSPDGQTIASCYYSGLVQLRDRSGTELWRKTWTGVCDEIEFAPDGALFVARGDASVAAGSPGSYVISRITAAGNYDPNWERSIAPGVNSFAFLSDGSVLVAQSEQRTSGAGGLDSGTRRERLLRFAANGAPLADAAFVADGTVEDMLVLSGDRVALVGKFGVVNHQLRQGLARLESVSAGLTPEAVQLSAPWPYIHAVKQLSDGGYLVAGRFLEVQGQTRRHLARFDRDFQLLPQQWDLDQPITSLVVAADGDCYVASAFPPLPSTSSANILRLDQCGNVDGGWQPQVADGVTSLVHGGVGDDAIYAASCAESSVTHPRDCRVQRFSTLASGLVGASWTVATDNVVSAMLAEGSSLYVGGSFFTIAGVSRASLAKLGNRSAGTLDVAWQPDLLPRNVRTLASRGDGRLIASGARASVGPEPRVVLMQYDGQTGHVDSQWLPTLSQGIGQSSMVDVAASTDGQLYFANYGNDCCVYRAPARGVVSAPDPGFAIGTNYRVQGILSPNANELLVWGPFSQIAGVSRIGLARIENLSQGIFVDQFE
jgi:hypothetical protein